jgi:hypothetical protein
MEGGPSAGGELGRNLVGNRGRRPVRLRLQCSRPYEVDARCGFHATSQPIRHELIRLNRCREGRCFPSRRVHSR